MSNKNKNLNQLKNTNYSVKFSNIPTKTDFSDMYYYENFVRSVVIPDYNLENVESKFKDATIRQPVTKTNEGLAQLSIEFFANENMDNYLNLFHWMLSIKHGINQEKLSNILRKNTIKELSIYFKNNHAVDQSRIYFTELFLENLSSISLVQGDSASVTFTTSWSYEEIGYELLS